jgi:hypothetical protein
MTTPDPDRAIVRCVDACANARDGRGRWRVQRECAQALRDSGSSNTVAEMSAAAAARLGAWVAQRARAIKAEVRR